MTRRAEEDIPPDTQEALGWLGAGKATQLGARSPGYNWRGQQAGHERTARALLLGLLVELVMLGGAASHEASHLDGSRDVLGCASAVPGDVTSF